MSAQCEVTAKAAGGAQSRSHASSIVSPMTGANDQVRSSSSAMPSQVASSEMWADSTLPVSMLHRPAKQSSEGCSND